MRGERHCGQRLVIICVANNIAETKCGISLLRVRGFERPVRLHLQSALEGSVIGAQANVRREIERNKMGVTSSKMKPVACDQDLDRFDNFIHPANFSDYAQYVEARPGRCSRRRSASRTPGARPSQARPRRIVPSLKSPHLTPVPNVSKNSSPLPSTKPRT
jgi:hypothetical protein